MHLVHRIRFVVVAEKRLSEMAISRIKTLPVKVLKPLKAPSLVLFTGLSLFWFIQILEYSFAFITGGWQGVKRLAGHLMQMGHDPFQGERVSVREFICAEGIFLVAFLLLFFVNMGTVKKLSGEIGQLFRRPDAR